MPHFIMQWYVAEQIEEEALEDPSSTLAPPKELNDRNFRKFFKCSKNSSNENSIWYSSGLPMGFEWECASHGMLLQPKRYRQQYQ